MDFIVYIIRLLDLMGCERMALSSKRRGRAKSQVKESDLCGMWRVYVL